MATIDPEKLALARASLQYPDVTSLEAEVTPERMSPIRSFGWWVTAMRTLYKNYGMIEDQSQLPIRGMALTQTKLVHALGIADYTIAMSTISQIENGQNFPGNRQLFIDVLCEVLEVPTNLKLLGQRLLESSASGLSIESVQTTAEAFDKPEFFDLLRKTTEAESKIVPPRRGRVSTNRLT